MRQRHAQRAPTRDAGHFDLQRAPAEIWNDDNGEPVAGGWPVLEIDTTGPPDIAAVASRVRAARQ
jgi:hypothetical protein